MPTTERARAFPKGRAAVEFAGKNREGAPTICPYMGHLARSDALLRGMTRIGSLVSWEGAGMGIAWSLPVPVPADAQAPRKGGAAGQPLLVVSGTFPYDARDAI